MKPVLKNIFRNHLRGVCLSVTTMLYKIQEKACLKLSVETSVMCAYTYEIYMYHTDCSIIETHFYMLYTQIYNCKYIYTDLYLFAYFSYVVPIPLSIICSTASAD